LDLNDVVLAQAKPVQEDALDIAVEWTTPVPSWPNAVKLRFKLTNARLFACWCP